MKTQPKRLGLPVAGLLFATLVIAGCGHSTPPAATTTAGGAQTTQPAQPTAAGIQADMSKVKSDSSLSAAQKQIMLDQMKHAQGQPPRPGTR